jgi:hypothetical protein
VGRQPQDFGLRQPNSSPAGATSLPRIPPGQQNVLARSPVGNKMWCNVRNGRVALATIRTTELTGFARIQPKPQSTVISLNSCEFSYICTRHWSASVLAKRPQSSSKILGLACGSTARHPAAAKRTNFDATQRH